MFKPLHWLFKVAGISPNSTSRDKYITSVALVVLLVSLHQSHARFDGMSAGFSRVLLLKLDVLYFNAIVFVVSSYMNRRSVPVVMSKAYCPTPGFEACLLAAFVTFATLKWADIFTTFGDLVFSTSNCIVYTANQVILAQHMLMVRGLSLRFTALNDRIVSFISQTRANPLANFKGPLNSVIVEHWNLQEVITKINSRYSLFFMLLMAGKLAYLIENIYWALMNISIEGFTTPVHFTVILMMAISVFASTFLCQICSDQAQRSVLLAHELWNVDGSADMMMDVKVFSLALRKKPVKFSAGGVFTLDGRFITKFSITALTYLIIAVQLSGKKHAGTLVAMTTETAGSTME